MCDLNKISGFIIAAQALIVAAMVLLVIAGVSASNPFSSPVAPGFMIAAAACIGGAVLALGFAGTAVAPCMTGFCGTLAGVLLALLLSLIPSLGAMAGTMLISAAGAAIPIVGVGIATVYQIALVAASISFAAIAPVLISLTACRRTPPSAVLIVAAFIAFGMGVFGLGLGLPPLTG